jgi:succinate-semialdehyde dehydrogenase/glutarate-semialdehyde dehydrogenase
VATLAFLVFADADLDAAVDGAMAAKMRNMGEACTAANRFVVEEAVIDEFSHRLATRMSQSVIGPGTDPGTDVGPLIDARARQKVHRLVSDAVAAGAEVLTGGAPVPAPGYFYQPTVLTGLRPDAGILHEEIFGPVAPIIGFRNEDEAIELANATEYGLASYVFTRDIGRGLRVSERICSGMLGLNTGVVSNAAAPFGGVKQSGLGREGGSEGLREYQDIQYVGIADPHRECDHL